MIEGVKKIPLRRIADDRGVVFHMLKKTDDVFSEFGEIYFTSLYKDVIKAWHIHTKMDLNYACISGAVKLVLYDSREDSATRGEMEEYVIGDHDYSLVHIPHGVTNGMKGLRKGLSMVANCATMVHEDGEMLRQTLEEAPFDYDWSVAPR